MVRAIAIVALVCSVWCASIVRADEASDRRENQLKAAYLLNFVKFVEWPPEAPGDRLVICFFAGAGVYDALAPGIDGKKVGARTLSVSRRASPADRQGCNVIYLGADGARDGQYPAADLVAGKAALTVSDTRDFARNGGMIELFTENNRLRFNINVSNAQKAGLRISSSLLQLAATIENGGRK